MNANEQLAAHYRHGDLEQALLAGLAAMGKDANRLTHGDLMGADEFHVGGAPATDHLVAQLGLAPGMHLLDLGSGLGGPARHVSAAHGCRVTGIDLTDEYVAVATSLTRRMGLAGKVDFRLGSAMDLPFDAETFDGATMLHVGMNIADKNALCAGVFRVLRPGGFFAIYDVMRVGDGDLVFPLPWSSAPETSFVAAPATYRDALTAAGFTIAAERDRAAFALEFQKALRARLKDSGPPPLGLQIVLGPTGPAKIANLGGLLERGVLAPVEMIARRP